MAAPPCSQQAFSLPEMALVTALLGVLVAFAPPFSNQLGQQTYADTLRDQLTSHLQFARTQAVLRGQAQQVCGASNGNACDGDWRRHWLITDAWGHISRRVDLARPSTLCWQGFGDQSVRFYSNGTSSSSNGRFSLCQAGRLVWQLILNRQGRLRRSDADDLADPQGSCCGQTLAG